jgi:hypothetical protein
MPLKEPKKFIDQIKTNPDIKVIRVLTTSENFENRFDGSVSYFFRQLKNGLNSVSGVPNREFFKNLSGCYFSLEEGESFELIIIYDASMTPLNKLQAGIRLKKLLGLTAQVEFGEVSEFEDRIREMGGIVVKKQLFGEYYFNRSSKAN